jgi:hypothetical protein
MELTHKNRPLKELAELALKEIYQIYKSNKGSENIYMGDIQKRLGLVEYDDRILQITALLEDKGYIENEMETEDGLAFVKLTPIAVVHLEETNDTSLNSRESRADNVVYNFFDKVEKSQFNTNSTNVTQINSDTDPNILDKIIEIIKSSNEIITSDKNELLSDIAIIKSEILKSKPDKTSILQRIESWSKILPLVQYIPAAIDWVKHNFQNI